MRIIISTTVCILYKIDACYYDTAGYRNKQYFGITDIVIIGYHCKCIDKSVTFVWVLPNGFLTKTYYIPQICTMSYTYPTNGSNINLLRDICSMFSALDTRVGHVRPQFRILLRNLRI